MLTDIKNRIRFKRDFNKRKRNLINYIKHDYNDFGFDEMYVEITKLLLENYLNYFSNPDNLTQCEEERLKTVNELKETLAIANRIIANNYSDEVEETYSCNKIENLVDSAYNKRRSDYKNLLTSINKYCMNWWD